MSGKVYPLHGNQRDAVNPRESVWLSASAGTGKTQVLSARVLRLLLEPGTDPSQILCLTFTKAGAAEMAERVNEVLARWVRMPDAKLAKELDNVGAATDPATISRARSLFAHVLDTPGGGLRIDTIHAFAQWLLAAFPQEAGITPGSQAMEDRDRDLLAREVLSNMVLTAERQRDTKTLEDLANFARTKDAESLKGWLMRCAGAAELWTGPSGWQAPMHPRVYRVLGLPADTTRGETAELCGDAVFHVAQLRQIGAYFADWSTPTGTKGAEAVAQWLARDDAGRLDTLDSLLGTVLTKAGQPLANMAKREEGYAELAIQVADSIKAVGDRLALIELADFLAPALELGRKFWELWDAAKAREGFVDFDDQIRRAAALLADTDMSAWIRYKLDRQFDHILIDEAQDTNEAQWEIIDALIDDFFSGEGARDGKLRTIFTVGDYKQAIFRFQGTSPENFEAAKQRVKSQMDAAAGNAERIRSNYPARRLQELGLDQSFRTASPVLGFVDRVIEAIGWQEIGLKDEPAPHEGQDRSGLVTLWNVVTDQTGDDPEDDSEEGWLARHDRLLADKIARQVAEWMRAGFPLVKGEERNAKPGDVMVLVRKRKELASLIVARLYAAGVPVAGVDRLRLGNPLAIKDLMAALRFAAQPLDDLSLANLLVSPLIGFGQDDLLAHAYRDKGVPLWDHIRKSADTMVMATADKLRDLLALADFELPQALLRWILVGPWDGRRALVERLGREVNDPIDELLNAAHAYSAAHTASLQGFIQWFDAGDGELKREAGEGADVVRVMTVHGSKGLQAPIVILADAADKPSASPMLALMEEAVGGGAARKVPLPGLSKEQRVGAVLDAHEKALAEEMQEHWRLLYVAMTRAEEALFIGGSLGPAEKKRGPHEDSWYARIRPLFDDGEGLDDPIWVARWEVGEQPGPIVGVMETTAPARFELPEWITTPVGPEPRPPRPLAPSSVGDDLGADPPLPPDALRNAARRGVLMHSLLERLPDVGVEARGDAAAAWLSLQASDLPDEVRLEMAAQAIAVLGSPNFADVFSPAALAEVPLAAIVDGQVVSGTVDRLLISPDSVVVVDFKTARRPPAAVDAIPAGILRQMAAYVAALEVIYPGRTVQAAVLYTQTPELFVLPAGTVERYKTDLSPAQERFPPLFVE